MGSEADTTITDTTAAAHTPTGLEKYGKTRLKRRQKDSTGMSFIEEGSSRCRWVVTGLSSGEALKSGTKQGCHRWVNTAAQHKKIVSGPSHANAHGLIVWDRGPAPDHWGRSALGVFAGLD